MQHLVLMHSEDQLKAANYSREYLKLIMAADTTLSSKIPKRQIGKKRVFSKSESIIEKPKFDNSDSFSEIDFDLPAAIEALGEEW